MRLRILVACVVLVVAAGVLDAANWPQWRGPSLNGIADERNLPVHWSTEANVTWKLKVPNWSGATPIVWEGTVFLNVAEADGDTLSLWAVDRASGEVSWKRPLSDGNNKQRKQNMSSPSPATDGSHVYVMTGTGILKAFDFDGHERWTRDIQADYGRFA